MILSLPFPTAKLRPNESKRMGGHWAHIGAVRDYRDMAKILTQTAINNDGQTVPEAPYKLSVTFHQADNRRRDLDNLMAAIKCMIDGIADATQIDDWYIKAINAEIGENRCTAEVVVRLETLECLEKLNGQAN